MPREIERQSERFANAPHLEDLPDSAYHGGGHLPPERGDYNERTRRYDVDPDEHNTVDEQTGYNWGPPPDSHYDPGLREHEVDPYPHA